jgi:hypothetical protein
MPALLNKLDTAFVPDPPVDRITIIGEDLDQRRRPAAATYHSKFLMQGRIIFYQIAAPWEQP